MISKSLKDLQAKCRIVEGRSSQDYSVHDSDECNDDDDDIFLKNRSQESKQLDRHGAKWISVRKFKILQEVREWSKF